MAMSTSTFNESDVLRQKAGQPTGGQFAEKVKASSGLSLAPEPVSAEPVESADELLDVVQRSLTDYRQDGLHGGPHYLQTVSQHLGGMEAERFEEDFFVPMVVALDEGDREEALRHAERAMVVAERERRWREHPTFTEPTFDVVAEDPIYGDRVQGSKYDPDKTLPEIGKALRADIKEAVEAGYLPEGLDYRVRTDSRGTSTIRVTAHGMPNEDYYVPGRIFGEPEALTSAQAQLLDERLETLAEAYTVQQSNSQVDYWNHTAHVSSRVYSASEVRQTRAWNEIDKAVARHRKARRDGDHEAAGQAAGDRVRAQQEYRQAVADHEALMKGIRARAE